MATPRHPKFGDCGISARGDGLAGMIRMNNAPGGLKEPFRKPHAWLLIAGCSHFPLHGGDHEGLTQYPCALHF